MSGPAGSSHDRGGRYVLHALFFVSGFTAVVYQTAWHRLLGLFAGAETISAALVVGAFLLGLGIGSLAAGLYADRLSRRGALIAFALCEVGIAVFAAASPWFYYDVLYRGLLPLATSRAAIFCVVFAGLLWPTFLMGCSLPFLSKAVVSRIADSAERIGWLYGVNTIGAGIGAFVGGGLLLGSIGFDKAIYLGALLNLVVAIGGLSLARFSHVTDDDPRVAAPAATGGRDAAVLQWSLLVFVSGFLIVALQIVWYRLVGVLLQSNGYGFPLVLGVFLVGDGLGLAVGARVIDRIADPRRFFFQMQGLAAVLALAGALFVYFGIGAGLLPSTFVDRDIITDGNAHDMALVALMLAAVVLPASFVMGFSFPVVQKAVQRDIERLGRRVGVVQFANIVGNCAGSLGAGLLLLDVVGTPGTIRLLGAIGLGFVLLQIAGGARRRAPYLLAAALVAALVAFPGSEAFWRRLHGLTVERAIIAEDKTGLSLLKQPDPQGGHLYIQGHHQSQVPFYGIHSFLGAVGPLVHPAPRQVLVIGMGTGGTPYAAGIRPDTQKVRVIEIVAPVVATMQRFVDGGGRSGVDTLLAGRKFDILVADGRHSLALDPMRYDVIEADAILPKTALSGLLYSREFMQQVRSRLAPGGIYVQWTPTKRSIETFRSVFPYVTMIFPAILGSDRPIPADRSRILERLDQPDIGAYLDAARIDRTELRRMFEQVKIEPMNEGTATATPSPNTDFFPRDEYYLNRPLDCLWQAIGLRC